MKVFGGRFLEENVVASIIVQKKFKAFVEMELAH